MKQGKVLIVLAVGLLAGAVFGMAKPNVIYINADDLGVMDVGFNNALYKTPNIDKLRAEGMLFTDAYAPAANCAPSRACVMSGQYGPRHAVSESARSCRKILGTRSQEGHLCLHD